MTTESLGHFQLTEDTKQHTGQMQLQTNPSGITTVILHSPRASFQTKTLELRDKGRIKIGRQTSSKTAPTPLNGYFDSKVLSRTHAEIWCNNGKIMIKDVKSSNGTFLNGQRLSPEGEESVPTEIKTHDEIEFGIDIANDDGSVLYPKVSCEVHIVTVPLSQVDSEVLRELNIGTGFNGTLDGPSSRKSSMSSSSSTLSTQSTLVESSKSRSSPQNLELVIAKLQNELSRSKEIQGQLRTIKESVAQIDKNLNNDTRLQKAMSQNALLQQQLEQAQAQGKAFADKCRHQAKAILSAQQELHRLQHTLRELEAQQLSKSTKDLERQLEEVKLTLEEEQLEFNKALNAEKSRCLEFENRCLDLERRLLKSQQPSLLDVLQMRAVQMALAVLVAVISALFYALVTV